MGDCEEPVESVVAEFATADLGGDLHPEETGSGHASAQFLDRQIGILQGHRAQGGEPVRVFGDDPGEEVILGRGQFATATGIGVVTEGDRNRGNNLQGNVIAVHVDQARLRRPAAVIDPTVSVAPVMQPGLAIAGAFDRRPAAIGMALRQIRQPRVDGVGVHIDESAWAELVRGDGGLRAGTSTMMFQSA